MRCASSKTVLEIRLDQNVCKMYIFSVCIWQPCCARTSQLLREPPIGAWTQCITIARKRKLRFRKCSGAADKSTGGWWRRGQINLFQHRTQTSCFFKYNEDIDCGSVNTWFSSACCPESGLIFQLFTRCEFQFVTREKNWPYCVSLDRSPTLS